MKRRYKIKIGVLLAIMIVLVGFAVWAETPSAPMPQVFDALESDSALNVSTNDWVIFQPTISNKNICFIIYPGGRVDYQSYAPMAHKSFDK